MTAYETLDITMQFERDVDAMFAEPGGPDVDIESLAGLLIRWRELHSLGVTIAPDAERLFQRLDCGLAA